MNQTYLPHEFAKRARVTIRALHHYDRLGLLKPSGRTTAGYRVYSDRDFAPLEADRGVEVYWVPPIPNPGASSP